MNNAARTLDIYYAVAGHRKASAAVARANSIAR
jgi:hypothetical protein